MIMEKRKLNPIESFNDATKIQNDARIHGREIGGEGLDPAEQIHIHHLIDQIKNGDQEAMKALMIKYMELSGQSSTNDGSASQRKASKATIQINQILDNNGLRFTHNRLTGGYIFEEK